MLDANISCDCEVSQQFIVFVFLVLQGECLHQAKDIQQFALPTFNESVNQQYHVYHYTPLYTR